MTTPRTIFEPRWNRFLDEDDLDVDGWWRDAELEGPAESDRGRAAPETVRHGPPPARPRNPR
jgi:hypothetical protein